MSNKHLQRIIFLVRRLFSADLVGTLRNERGTALILALIMLALMSLLGVMALNSTDTELSISSNFRASQHAFYAAERAVEYAITSETIYASIGTGGVTLDGDHALAIAAETSNSHLKTNEVNEVRFLTTGNLPPGVISDQTHFQSRFYTINVIAEGPSGATSRVEAQVARVVPK